ncbi:MAG: alpha/beta hydrolase [Solobacterium sp.]|nr:alpha/beta hydrolase [Solobacterium sp.]
MKKRNILGSTLLLGGAGYLATAYYVFKNAFDLQQSKFLERYYSGKGHQDEELERWFMSQNMERVSITSDDYLKLQALRIEGNPKSDTWMIMVHGYQSRALDMKYYMRMFSAHVQNFLVIDQRGHGLSEGRYTGMGWLEQYDLLGWIQHLVSYRPKAKIILFGLSLGAATVMNTVGNHLPENVICAIEDCGFSDIKEEISYLFQKDAKISCHPFFPAIELMVEDRVGFSLSNASTRRQLIQSRIPMLFIHGDQDQIVPASMVKENYYACGSDKQLAIFEGKGHGMSITDPSYVETIFTFVKHYL